MSDTPHPDPLDEQASDLFDAGADAPGDEPELGARLDEFRALRDALADVPPAPDAQRTGAIAAALALFDELAVGEPTGTEVTAADAADDTDDTDDGPAEPTVVTALRPAAPPGVGAARPDRYRRRLAVLGAAASVVVVLGVVALVRRDTGRSGVDAASSAALDGGGSGGGFSQAKAADPDAPVAEAAGDTAAGGADTTAAAAPTVAAAASSTSARAATSAAAATTTAPADSGLTSPAAAESTSTTDRRDATSTTASADTTGPPTTTSTNVDASALPYLGELTALDDVDAALRALPPFDGADAGAPIRAQLAGGVCDLRPYGTPVAVLRWNGRDSVLLRSADAPIVRLIPLDGCNPIEQLDAPS